MMIIKSATKIFLLWLWLFVCVAFMIVVIMNTQLDAVIVWVMTMVNIMVGAVMGYFFKHQDPTNSQTTDLPK